MGGKGKDTLDGGLGANKKSDGDENSSTLRAALAARLINWKDSFKGFGAPFTPFGTTKVDKIGKTKPTSFDFLEFDE